MDCLESRPVTEIQDPTTLPLTAAYTPPPGSFRDRWILVSGAGGGIGAAVTRALAREKARLVLLGPNPDELSKLHDEIVSGGAVPPLLQAIDFRGATVADLEDLAAALETQCGHLDGLLHNAGILGYHGPLQTQPPEAWMEVMQINLQAPFALTRACLPLLTRSEDASVVFTTSEWGRRPRAYAAAHGVMAGGVENLMRILSDEMEFHSHLRFNAVDPGWVATDFVAALFPGHPPSAWPQPEEVTGGYLYLLGPESRGITGRLFVLDGPAGPSTRVA